MTNRPPPPQFSLQALMMLLLAAGGLVAYVIYLVRENNIPGEDISAYLGLILLVAFLFSLPEILRHAFRNHKRDNAGKDDDSE